MSDFKTIKFVEHNGIAELTLNRPESLNALSTVMVDEILDVLDRIRKSARVLLLTGAGRGFCSGADLNNSDGEGLDTSDVGATLESHSNPMMEKLANLPFPFIVAVNGVAAGAGCSFALLADFVIAANTAYFVQSFINVGLVPDSGATWLLPRLIGKSRATAMMMLGERVSAAKAEAWGLVHQVVEPAELPSAAQMLATRLSTGPTMAYGLIRKGIRFSQETDFPASLRTERAHQKAAGKTADFAEGLAAFANKRPPVFRGE